MRLNEATQLKMDSITLTPYTRDHVVKYHEWMKDPFLQEMTASEPLTLEEEYEMQQSWRSDDDKLTFIIHIDSQMAGDTNLYLNDFYDKQRGEIEIMIAEPQFRGKGYAKHILSIMMDYCTTHLNLTHFTAKISLKNQQSLKLFERLSFVEIEKSDYFQEVTLELAATNRPSISYQTLSYP
ncbi:N-acetyltransferase 9-like protein [Gorgonomyces haynaldii]|nr:N-acetyltransferase 9-like protein [Gorgonomyces haynaldii]